jgi:hypothetical protein
MAQDDTKYFKTRNYARNIKDRVMAGSKGGKPGQVECSQGPISCSAI